MFEKSPANGTFSWLFGSDESFRCVASGVPAPTITWYKNGSPILNSNRVTEELDGTLLFTDVTKEEEGVYQCVAQNIDGRVQSSGTVSVYCKIS